MFATTTEKSDKIRMLGRSKFVWRYGVLGWGVSTAILFSLILGYTDGWDSFLFKLVPALVIFPIGGFAWGHFMWMFFNRMNNRSLSEE